LIRTNTGILAPGAAVTAYVSVAGEPLTGVAVPSSAILRHQGGMWVFVETDGTNFTRRLIEPVQPVKDGWFVTNGISAGDHVVVTGAQTVFSDQLKAGGFTSGERE